RDAARGASETGDRVPLSPEALRGLPGQGGDAGGSAGSDGRAGDAGAAGDAPDFRSGGEALLLARGLANAMAGDPGRAALVHDLVSPTRAASLLRL
ncbi:hypothetical protein PYV61_04370, partial [Roseisolibacter sp. H3M3-2]